jgi:hypothetical protein
LSIVVGATTGVRIGVGCAAAAWASMILPSACGDADGAGEIVSFQALEQALCEKALECGCGAAFAEFGAVAPLSCDGWSLDDIAPSPEEGYYAYGDDYGNDYDPLPVSLDEECVRQIAARIDGLTCGLAFGEPLSCREYCPVFIGPRLEGQSCAIQEHCGRGLQCHRGECTDPCLVRPPAEGDACVQDDCGSELVCSASDPDPGICVALPLAGAPCIDGRCATGLSCDGTVCFAPLSQGEACMGHGECASRYCPAGHCSTAPGPDQPCGANGACASGSECIDEFGDGGTCRVRPSAECVELVRALLGFQ